VADFSPLPVLIDLNRRPAVRAGQDVMVASLKKVVNGRFFGWEFGIELKKCHPA
jgi:hypothetical protein